MKKRIIALLLCLTVALAFEALRQGRAEAAVVAGADGLSPVTLATFQTVKAMSSGYASPFDKNRDGINVGEGAAMLLLEPLERARARGAAIFGEILGAAELDYALYAVVAACRALAPDTHGAHIQRDIVIDNYDVLRRYIVKVHSVAHRLTALVHKGLGAHEQTAFAADNGTPAHSVELVLGRGGCIFFLYRIQCQKACVVSCLLIGDPGIAKACYNKFGLCRP